MDQDLFEQLEAYVDGELSPEESSALLLAISDQPEARETLRGLERLKKLVRQAGLSDGGSGEVRAPDALRASILADLDRGQPPQSRPGPGREKASRPEKRAVADPRVVEWQPRTLARWGLAAGFFLAAILTLRLLWPESVAHARVVDELRAEYARVAEVRERIDEPSAREALEARLEKFINEVAGKSDTRKSDIPSLPEVDGADCYRVSEFTCQVNGRGLRLDFLCEETKHHLLCAFLFPKTVSAECERLAAEIEAGRRAASRKGEGASGYLCHCKSGASGEVYCVVRGEYLLFLVGVDPRGAFVKRYENIFGEL